MTASAPRPTRRAVPDRGRAIEAVRQLLAACGADTGMPELARTPERVADFYLEVFSRADEDPAVHLGIPLPWEHAVSGLERPAAVLQTIALAPVPFWSVCEHHMLPFSGIVEVRYTPRRCIAGLGRITGTIRAAARRPQLQERLALQIADALARGLDPVALEVTVTARHGCIAFTDPEAAQCEVVTTASVGVDGDVVLEKEDG